MICWNLAFRISCRGWCNTDNFVFWVLDGAWGFGACGGFVCFTCLLWLRETGTFAVLISGA